MCISWIIKWLILLMHGYNHGTVEPASTSRPLVQKKTLRDSLPIDMLLSVLVVAQSSSEVPEGLMNNPIYIYIYIRQVSVTRAAASKRCHMQTAKYSSVSVGFFFTNETSTTEASDFTNNCNISKQRRKLKRTGATLSVRCQMSRPTDWTQHAVFMGCGFFGLK